MDFRGGKNNLFARLSSEVEGLNRNTDAATQQEQEQGLSSKNSNQTPRDDSDHRLHSHSSVFHFLPKIYKTILGPLKGTNWKCSLETPELVLVWTAGDIWEEQHYVLLLITNGISSSDSGWAAAPFCHQSLQKVCCSSSITFPQIKTTKFLLPVHRYMFAQYKRMNGEWSFGSFDMLSMWLERLDGDHPSIFN